MEQALKIKTKDGALIYGILQYPSKRVKKVVVFVHGLTGHMNAHGIFNCARELSKQGIATCRFNLYDWRPNSRNLEECTIQTHAEDLNRVVRYLKKRGYNSIGVVGHSLGAPTIFMSDNSQYSAVVLWDPSSPELWRGNNFAPYDRKLRAHVLDWGVRGICGKAMVKEIRTLPDGKDLITNVTAPILIIGAEKGILVKACREYHKVACKPKKLVVIPKATHCFDEEGTEEKLIKATGEWVKRHL